MVIAIQVPMKPLADDKISRQIMLTIATASCYSEEGLNEENKFPLSIVLWFILTFIVIILTSL